MAYVGEQFAHMTWKINTTLSCLMPMAMANHPVLTFKKRFDMVEDLHELMLALELGTTRHHWTPMGAEVAAEFAIKYPEMLSLLVLEDPS